MANKRSREVANGAPETTQTPTTGADHLVSDPILETLDPSTHESPGGYEHFREQRIKENLERMQKLGILDLALKMKSTISAASSLKRGRLRRDSSERKTPLRSSSLFATDPPRRSSRLQNATPVSYVEKVKLPKEEKQRRDLILLEEGAKPEVYTEEHEKLLGSTESTWTLFVDGYGADGKRIYDPVKGKTCHQCRQKTLGHRTHCSKCRMVQGQFCGDCLYMRYGEHVLEANKNPDWICPPCRGICNCSLCRQARGWPPTGTMYKKISSLGYKSVAHFLIQTKRAPREAESQDNVNNTPHSAPLKAESDENINETAHSAKRSLAFTDMEVLANVKEAHSKAIDGQKLDYGDTETGESKDKGEQEDCGKNCNSMLNVGESDVKEGAEMVGKSDDQMEAEISILIAGESNFKEGPEIVGEKGEQEDCGKNCNSMLNFGESDVKEGAEMVGKSDDQMEAEISILKAGESNFKEGPEIFGENGDQMEAEISIVCVGESDVKEGLEIAKNDEQMTAEMSPEPVNKTVSSSEPKSDGVASRTRSRSGKGNPDASNGIVETEKVVENEAVSSSKLCATKTRWRAKVYSSPASIQDSIARRLRSRTVRT